VHFLLAGNKKKGSAFCTSLMMINTIRVRLQFPCIAKRVRFRIQSKERHIDRANILPADRLASVHNWQCAVLNSVLPVLPYWRELS
jgi:hypothetical protein